jgi:hypothetical protein
MDDKQNANPTILSLSDLPSRRRGSNVKRRDDGGTGLFDDLIPQYGYLNDPFEQPLSSSDSDDDSVEDIDEQEVYGALKAPARVSSQATRVIVQCAFADSVAMQT